MTTPISNQASSNPAQSASLEITSQKIKTLVKLIGDMAGMLSTQRDLLAQRDIKLPPEPLDELHKIGMDLNNATAYLHDDRIELSQLRELARVTAIVNSTLDLDHVLGDVVDTVITLTGAERGYVVLRDTETGELDYRVARNFKQNDLTNDQFIISRTVIERVANSGQPVVTTNAEEDERFTESESIANYMLRSILCVPLKRKGEVTGVIYADNRNRPDLFSPREQRLVYAFANQAAIAIENARLFESARASLAEITSIKDFMANIFASIASGVIATDSRDVITTMNDAAARILDIPHEECIGASIWAVLPSLYDGFERQFAEVRDHNLTKTIEVDTTLPGRGPISLTLKLTPLQDSAQVTQGVTIVLNDLTDLRQRQARLSVVRRYLPPAMLDNIREIDELELSGMEREISVLSCDVRNFTTFSENLDPQELMQVINKYLTVSSEAINLYEGIIDKYMGDAVVGLFNTQLNPQQDHALRAVRTALTMVYEVTNLHDVLPPAYRLFYGIGVHSSTAILGNVGSPTRKEFTVIGDALQFAKLLQENALGGEVLISQETYNLLKDSLIVEALTPRKTKGREDFTVMYKVKGIVRGENRIW